MLFKSNASDLAHDGLFLDNWKNIMELSELNMAGKDMSRIIREEDLRTTLASGLE